MTLLVDTSVWSLALRRDTPAAVPEVAHLSQALAGGEVVVTTGVILQEVLQGIVPAATRRRLLESLQALHYVTPSSNDHVDAAGLRNHLRASGIQVGTIDALIAQLALSRGCTLLTTDWDFHHAARHVDLSVWRPATRI